MKRVILSNDNISRKEAYEVYQNNYKRLGEEIEKDISSFIYSEGQSALPEGVVISSFFANCYDYRIYIVASLYENDEFIGKILGNIAWFKSYQESIDVYSSTGAEFLAKYFTESQKLKMLEEFKSNFDRLPEIYPHLHESKRSNQSEASKKLTFNQVKEMIEETEDDILDDDTPVSNYLNELIYKVTQSLKIELEGSAQAGEGVMTIYDSNMDEVLNEVDYASFNYDIIDLAMESNNASSFKKKVKEYLQNLI